MTAILLVDFSEKREVSTSSRVLQKFCIQGGCSSCRG